LTAPAVERVPYAWAIEYQVSGERDRHVAFIRHDERHDRAYAMQRAADLHGELVPLFTDRRTT
jgi:hypothetical protein